MKSLTGEGGGVLAHIVQCPLKTKNLFPMAPYLQPLTGVGGGGGGWGGGGGGDGWGGGGLDDNQTFKNNPIRFLSRPLSFQYK